MFWAVFLKGLVKFMEIGNFEDLVLFNSCFNYNFKLIIGRCTSKKQLPTDLGFHCGAGQQSGGVPFNKLTSVFYASVLLLIINFVITLLK